MKYKRFKIKIVDIIPQQHYLNREKLNKAAESFEEFDSYGDIYVIEYKGLIFSIDGHHRLFNLYKQGVEEIEVVNEIEDNDNELYKLLADEAEGLGLKTIADLELRILETEEEYKKKWVDKCQRMLRSLKNKNE